MTSQAIAAPGAPSPIGPYSPAVRAGDTVYLSGQTPLDPQSMELVSGMREQAHQVFRNLRAVANAASGDLSDIVKLNIYLTNLADFSIVNEVMAEYFNQPYPARTTIGVASLPVNAGVEIEGILVKAG